MSTHEKGNEIVENTDRTSRGKTVTSAFRREAPEPPGDGASAGTSRALRKEAEVRASQTIDPQEASLNPGKARDAFHELRVHQIELEMQNEELRRTQVALDTARARYFDLYNLAPVGYVTVDKTNTIIEANLRVADMLGLATGELVGQPMTRFIHDEDQDIYYLHRKKLLETGQNSAVELRLKCIDGTRTWARLDTAIAEDAEKRQAVCRMTLSDISEQRTLQASLAQSDRMASMGLLAAGVAHEINNPLTFVLYNLETLSEDTPPLIQAIEKMVRDLREPPGPRGSTDGFGEDAPRFGPLVLADFGERLEQAADGVRRIQEITKSLNTFSRAEKIDLRLVDLNLAFEESIAMTNHEVQCRATLHKAFGQIPMVMATEGKLVQVFVNLIVNATHAIPEGVVDRNRISLRTWVEEDRVFAEVADTGSGIAPGDIDRIFEPFFTTKGPKKGVGLGLAMTQRIIDEINGKIHVESRIGEGTRVRIGLPIPHGSDTPRPQEDAPEAIGRARILVVDDESMVRRVIQRILEREHDVTAVDSGRAAQKLIEEDANFDLILCDVMMPELTGIDLHVWLSKHHPRLAAKLAFISGGIFTPFAGKYLSTVSNARIEKPFHRDGLIKQVNKILRGVSRPHEQGGDERR